MNSPPTSSLRFIDGDGAELAAPLEWASCLVELTLPLDDWHELRLERDDRSLQFSQRVLDGKLRIVADWPRSPTGDYELRLAGNDGQEGDSMRCRIESRKLDVTAYAELLTDLEARLPVSIVLSLKRLGALTGIQVGKPGGSALGEELAKLRRAIEGTGSRPGLAAVLVEVARDPHRVPVSTEAWVSSERARRVLPARLAQAMALSGNLDRGGLPVRLPEVRVRESVDVYENRLLKTFKEQVEQRLGRLESALRRRRKSTTRTKALAECQALRMRLAPATKGAGFLAEVEALPHVPDRLTMVLLRRPDYRGALEGLLELHRRAGVRLAEPSLAAPLEQLPKLYETWGKLQTIDVLLELARKMGFEHRHQDIVGREPGGAFIRILPGNRPALKLRRDVDGAVVRLVPGRRYEEDGAPYGSASFRQEPDIAVEIERPDGTAEICLFDPKYKLESGGDEQGKPKKADIDTMHAYRDAIRDGEGRRVVRHASILYPGPSRSFGEGLGAVSAVPGAAEAMRDELRKALVPLLSAAKAPEESD
jgi:hypothetical protein